MTSSKYICKPKDKVDTIDLKIIKCLSRDCRMSYREISSIVGLTPNAIKERINTMVCNGIIQSFIVNVNPSLFGYEKECLLTLKHFYKKTMTTITREENIVKQLNLLGDVRVYAKLLQRSAMFAIAIKPGAEDKIALVVDLLKREARDMECAFMNYRPISTKIHSSDFKILMALLSNARMRVEDIAKETSLSTKTVTRRMQILREKHIVEFGIIRNMSSMQLEGYIEFGVLVHLQDDSLYEPILDKICQEMQEYLFVIPHFNQREELFLVFFCPNIPTVDLILRSIESYEGVDGTEMFITTKLAYYQEWVRREIDRKLKSEEVQLHQQQPLATQ
ncbi:MAG TPA: AsnC family transcriptional regulator [Nitrososphaeraceae archaeon]|nr:AsnC family transcriptional regulator [Nitrososphaeraceae archaeon]